MRRHRLWIAAGASVVVLFGAGVRVATADAAEPNDRDHWIVEDFRLDPVCSGVGTLEVLVDVTVSGTVNSRATVGVHAPGEENKETEIGTTTFVNKHKDPFTQEYDFNTSTVSASYSATGLAAGQIVTIHLSVEDKEDPLAWSAGRYLDAVSPGCEIRTSEPPEPWEWP